ncbi:MAG: hypothetical protein E5V89_14590, partial [Mesorhizobium sp.]
MNFPWVSFFATSCPIGSTFPIFSRRQRNSEDGDLPGTGRRTMKAIVVTDPAAGTAGMKLVERP